MDQIFNYCLSQRVIHWTWSDESDNDFLSPIPSPQPLSTFPDIAVAFLCILMCSLVNVLQESLGNVESVG